MPNIKINGQGYNVVDGLTLIQVCDSLNIQIPRFCYHEKLPAVGSCRMCLVELKNSPKLVPACTTAVTEGMEIVTESSPIDNARQTMIELLLVNHPLDCPICDQGGECDLQDESYRYGLDKGRLNVEKRAVKDKNFGPLIDSYMTRCIHCTRCIRFAQEIAGVQDLGGIGRGDHTEITTYVNKTIDFELSGNLADICPVGALTNSSYAFKARPWELISTETIDVMDASGCNIKADCSPLAVLRIQPRINEEINEEWLPDKSRYIVDALRLQRLDSPMIRVNGKLQKVSWDSAFKFIADHIKDINGQNMGAIVGEFVDLETMYALKDLMAKLDCDNLESRHQNVAFNPNDRSSYLFNTTIAKIEEADSCLIIGSNPRIEAPVLNARLRKRYLKGNFKVALIGEQNDLRYKYDHLGENILLLQDILDGQNSFAKVLQDSEKPMLIIGIGAINGQDGLEVINLCKKIAQKYGLIKGDWNGFNVLQTSTSQINGLHLGFTPKDHSKNISTIIEEFNMGKFNFLWLVNYDDINSSMLKKDSFIVYQGHHGDAGASVANVILPGALWLEKDSSFINLEGRLQRAYKAVPCIGDAREDWKIIRKFSEYLNIKLDYNSLEELRNQLHEEKPFLAKEGLLAREFIAADDNNLSSIVDRNIKTFIDNYYITDIISKNSPKMAECSSKLNDKN